MSIGGKLAAQQRETAATALAEMERAHRAEARLESARAWAQQSVMGAAPADPVEEMRARCEAIAREGSFPFDIDVWLNSTKKEMTAHVALAIADAIAALKVAL